MGRSGKECASRPGTGDFIRPLLSWLVLFLVGVQGLSAAPLTRIAVENALPGNPATEWDIPWLDDTIQGFTTDISVNVGQTVRFKVDTDATNYRIKIYRMGYYQGNGARLITTVNPSVSLPQVQPAPITNAALGLVDCGNWAQSASWAVPSNAVSGLYIGKLIRTDTGGASHIYFVVRDDAGGSDVLLQTSDATWQAYNSYGGRNLYDFFGSTQPRAYKVSYNRPVNTREAVQWATLFTAEIPMIRWIEANGYDVSYTTCVDTDRRGNLLPQHRVFLSVGHDEYWSGGQRANVEAARNAGVNLAFFSANEVFWKTRFENSIDGSGTPYRTLVCYKETKANAKIDPSPVWTGTWRDPRFSPPSDGGQPENLLTGTIFIVNGVTLNALEVPAAYGAHRFWRNTTVAALQPGQKAVFGPATLGFEWDEAPDNGPPGLMRLSLTTANNVPVLTDYGNTYVSGTATHSLSLYRHSSGALVFGAGTVQWSWGLDEWHDNASYGGPPDPPMQQATVNLLADMGAQPSTLQAGLVPAAPSTDNTAPASVISAPLQGLTLQPGVPTTITGTASDSGGGQVWNVEVSTDSGTNWYSAVGKTSWTYAWTPASPGTFTIKTRAVDDSGNLETPAAGVTVTVPADQFTTWPSSAGPAVADSGSDNPIALGLKFRSDAAGMVTGIRFYKSKGNVGPHVGSLWTTNGTLLASVTFAGESASGWQQMNFSSPVSVASNTVYVASYHCTQGHYSYTVSYFAAGGTHNPPLHALGNNELGPNGVFRYGNSGTFPNQTFNASHYWVDVAFESPLVMNTSALANGTLGVTYSRTLAASGGKKAYTWSISSGSLPPGLTLNPSTGAIAGTPTTTGVYSFTAQVGDSSIPVQTISRAFTITIYAAAPLTIWPDTALPAVIDGGADNPVQLGVKFQSSVAGTITGIRFYKSSANVGPHVGSLWTTNGTRLASAVFDNETASGWQQVDFATPVAITANTVYVASYHVPQGHYSATVNYFIGSVNNPPLRAPSTSEFGGNGVYAYGPSTLFPSQTSGAANYWVDVAFQTPLVINTVSLPNGTLQTAYTAALSASSGKTPYSWSIATGSLPPGLTLNPSTGAISGTPTTTGNFNFTVQISDAANPVQTATKSLTVTIYADAPLTIWPATATPSVTGNADNPVQLGVKFRADVAGTVTGVRFYKSSANVGTHVGSLWTTGGTLLASAPFAGETPSGWQKTDFPTAVAISAGTTYIASYHCPNGFYGIDMNGLASGVDNPPLHALANGASGGNGVFIYGPSTVFPSLTFGSANYWVDVAFQTPLVLNTVFLANGIMGTPYSAPLSASSGKKPYTWSISAGSLPPGLTINASSGVISGTPTTTGAFGFTVRVADAANPMATATKALTITIYAALPLTIWPTTATPAVADAGPDDAIELGVKFRADVAGTITGVRFYKSAANSGKHVGNLWTTNGTLLATATSANETASGWQQVDFATPIAVSANTIYVASYHSVGGHYSIDMNYFALSGYDNAPLHAVANGVSSNGVYAYGPTSLFPSQTYGNANYWVDVAFQTPLAINTASVPNGNLTTPYSAPLSASSGRTPYAWSISAGSLPPGLSLNSSSGVIAGTPTTTGSFNFTVRVSDSANPSQTATKSFAVSIYPAASSIWPGTAVPSILDAGADSPVQLGVKFQSDTAGTITGIRFYKSSANTGTHVGSLWTSTGTLLASATFTSESGSGWQKVDFATPVAVSANTIYVASYHCNTGHYSIDSGYFNAGGADNGVLHALPNATPGGNGVYGYGASNVFPSQTFGAANYWVDVVFISAP